MSAIEISREEARELYSVALALLPSKKSLLAKLKRACKEPIKIASRKAKGRNFQKWVCEKLSSMFGIKHDGCDTDLIQSRGMGLNGSDIVLFGDMREKFPYDVECKNQESIHLKEWIAQAKKNEGKNRKWLLAIKSKSLDEPVFVMDFDGLKLAFQCDRISM